MSTGPAQVTGGPVLNRRIIFEAPHEGRVWGLVKSLLIFIAALAIAALLSIDDYDSPKGHEHGASEER